MGPFRFIGRQLKSSFNVSAWMDLKNIKSSAKLIKQASGDAFSVKQSTHEETFEQAVKRLKLSKSNLLEKQRSFFMGSLTYAGLAVADIGYLVYQITMGRWFPVLICSLLFVILLGMSLKEYRWYLQMKRQILGVSAQDCFASLLANILKR